MKTLIFFNNKGGVGKTASVTTISHMLAERFGKKVLMVDLDPQMNTTNLYSKVDFIDLFRKIRHGIFVDTRLSVEDLLLDKERDVHDCIHPTGYNNLDLIPAYLTLSEAEERLKADLRTPQQFRLKGHLERIEKEYDFCVIDASPSLSILNINGLAAADEVYIPLRCDGNSLVGASITMNLVESVKEYNSKLQIGGMFCTQWDGRKNISKAVYQLMEAEYGEYLLPIFIPAGKNVEECSLTQKPLLAYEGQNPKSKVAAAYMKLAEYIMISNRKAYMNGIRVCRG